MISETRRAILKQMALGPLALMFASGQCNNAVFILLNSIGVYSSSRKPNMKTDLGSIIRTTVDAWNRHDLISLGQYLSDDIVLVHPSLSGPLRGKENYIKSDQDFLRSFPDAHIEIVSILSQGDLVAFEFVMTGTHLGEFKGKVATGKRISIPVVEMTLFRGGKICEVRRYLDTDAYNRQLS